MSITLSPFDIYLDILLPTYQGEKYLPELLRSIFKQSFSGWRLTIRDDGSTDNTFALAQSFAQNEQRLKCFRGIHCGVVQSFNVLLQESIAPYFMLADQDDIWHESKISLLLEAIKKLEKQYGSDIPLLVYSDAELVDQQGKSLGKTFRKLHQFPDDWENSLQHLLIMSPAPGCTMLGNAALRAAVLPLPHEDAIFMHDWWLLLCAFVLGHIQYIPLQLVQYRQHPNNTLGAKQQISLSRIISNIRASRANVLRTQRQAITLLDRHRNKINPEGKFYCQEWGSMIRKYPLMRIARALSMGFAKPRGLRNFFFYMNL